MSGPLDDFINQCASDCVNASEPEPKVDRIQEIRDKWADIKGYDHSRPDIDYLLKEIERLQLQAEARRIIACPCGRRYNLAALDKEKE